jgi:hypothetical protein
MACRMVLGAVQGVFVVGVHQAGVVVEHRACIVGLGGQGGLGAQGGGEGQGEDQFLHGISFFGMGDHAVRINLPALVMRSQYSRPWWTMSTTLPPWNRSRLW